ncbi:probable glutathione S-transferase GSTF1 [Setaria viridis]|uniref:probable glutathione S-transferase GSTF1 n=1 Tax=Setaria viridis TaxID=4556 RepID=UPI003B3AB4E4
MVSRDGAAIRVSSLLVDGCLLGFIFILPFFFLRLVLLPSHRGVCLRHQRRSIYTRRYRQNSCIISSESRAISRYVLRKFKTPDAGTNNLLRDGDLEGSALVDAWLDVEALLYEPAVHAVFVQHRVVPALGGAPDEKVIGESVEKLRKVLEVYEARLGERRYLAGDDVSLADLSHFPYTHYFMGMPYAAVFDAFPRVRSWWQDLMARPAVQRVAAMMDGQ